MPRNTLIVIILLGIFAAIVAGVNLGRNAGAGTQSRNTSITPTIKPTPTPSLISYTDTLCKITFSYPDNFTKVEIQTGGVTLVDQKNSKETIVAICQKDIPRVPLPKDKIESLKIGSISANLYHDTSEKDGTPIDKLIFTHPKTKKDIYIAGYGASFNNLIETLTID